MPHSYVYKASNGHQTKCEPYVPGPDLTTHSSSTSEPDAACHPTGSTQASTKSTRPSVIYKELLPGIGDARPTKTGSEVDLNLEDVKEVQHALRECLWMVEVVLQSRKDRSSFNDFFKDHRYHNTILGKSFPSGMVITT